MKTLFYMFARMLGVTIYLLVHSFPRKKNIWIFGEPKGFNNNSKYLYLDILENHSEIRAIWIGDNNTVNYLRQLGYPAYSKYSILGIWYCLRAKVYVVSWLTNDINLYFSGGAYVVNLWHGIGWKKCLWLEPQNVCYNPKIYNFNLLHFLKSPTLYFPPQLLVTSSEYYTRNVFTHIFNVSEDRCIETTYPRCDFMLKGKTEIKAYLQKFNFIEQLNFINSLSKYDKVYLYTPTFRDDSSDFITNSGIEFDVLNELMRKKNSLFILKLHPNTYFDEARLHGYANIVYLDTRYDLYPLMPFTDLMISDYSSILVDYMLLHKPIVLFAFDLENYTSNCRDLIVDFKTATDGIPVVTNFSDLLRVLEMDIPYIKENLYKMYWDPKYDLISAIKNNINFN